MKKVRISLLALMLLLSLTACTGGVSAPTAPSLPTVVATQTAPENAMLEALRAKYGEEFKLWCPEGMELYAIYIYEDHAERNWSSSLADYEIKQNELIWTIEGDELVITGEWSERFTIDPDAGTAISQTDNREYKLYSIERKD